MQALQEVFLFLLHQVAYSNNGTYPHIHVTPLLTYSRLVPIQVHQALAVFESTKDALVKEEITKVRDATNELNGYVLISISVDHLFLDLSLDEIRILLSTSVHTERIE